MLSYVFPRRLAVPRIIMLFICLALLVSISALSAPRALAHDVLLATTPADGEVTQGPPTEVALTFSGELVEVSPLILVSDASGTVITDESPTLEGRTATLQLPDLAGGVYQVDWSVVSSDGHRIEDTFEFTVQGTQSTQPATSPQSADSADQAPAEESTSTPTSGQPTPTSDADTTTSSETEEPGGFGGLSFWLVFILALAVVGAVIVFFVYRRQRRSPE